MSEPEAQIRGYIDPRTGEYKLATEANAEEVKEDMGFLIAWKFYWTGPLTLVNREPVYDRETWLVSEQRQTWLDALSTEQREMLADSFPPEEIPDLTTSEVESG